MGLDIKTKIKVDLFLDALKDMRNTAVKSNKEATTVYEEELSKSLIMTFDVLIMAYCNTFEIEKPEMILVKEEINA